MYIFGNFLMAIAKVIDVVLNFYIFVIFFRAIISWVNPDPNNPLVRFLYSITEPVLQPIRRKVPRMAIDLSPLIVFLVIIFLRTFLVASLYEFGYSMRKPQTHRVLNQSAPAVQSAPLVDDQLVN